MAVSLLEIREADQYSPVHSQFMQSYGVYQEYNEPVVDNVDYEVAIQRTDGMGLGSHGSALVGEAEGIIAAPSEVGSTSVRNTIIMSRHSRWTGEEIRISCITNTKQLSISEGSHGISHKGENAVKEVIRQLQTSKVLKLDLVTVGSINLLQGGTTISPIKLPGKTLILKPLKLYTRPSELALL
ncbi:hypothetical protein BC830DRAFT_1083969 [Chytriomyces sp. MP71]|nr:hypothetical protein BC830DRAFT_1083969 [Chytriomyces sp. MP71]